MNTTEVLNISAAIVPDRTAINFDGAKFTFADLNERTNKLAHALAKKYGLKKGDAVGVMQVNTNDMVETYFACAKLGVVFVPINFRARQDEVSYMLKNSEAKAVFCGERYMPLMQAIKPECPTVKHFVCYEKKAPGFDDYESLLKSGVPGDVTAEIDDNDTTVLMYTAGTTGLPKGVPLRHEAFGIYLMNNVSPADPETEEKNILTVPLYHVAGIQAMMAAIYGGRTLVLMRQFEVEPWMKLVQQEKVDRAMLVPTMLKNVIDHPDFKKYNLSSLKVITYGAAPMPFEVIRKAIEVFPKSRFINAFGQTETASTITMLGPDDHVITGTPEEKAKKLKRLESSIGRPLDDVEVKIFSEDGKEVGPSVVGEIAARGARVMRGYWKDEAKTKETIKGGWLWTGDLGYMDEEGYIFLAGRSKDLIIRGGENVTPAEVENVIMTHPAVDDAAIIGVPDVTWGETIRAVVVLKEGQKATAGEIVEHCRTRLSSFKKPDSVVFVKELPRNPMGKVLKRVLRDEYGKP
ncbi:MAG: long-chain-fatty-acid--CoA ligase [Chloroflexi bacterium]|nr:long-chain-fatty-acid--CoA ligase [Chloroflexota bacterium]